MQPFLFATAVSKSAFKGIENPKKSNASAHKMEMQRTTGSGFKIGSVPALADIGLPKISGLDS